MTETVKLQVTADASKVNPELAKVQKDLGQLAASTKRLEEGFGKFGSRLTQAFSLGAITAFMVKINSAADQLNDLSDRLGASASGLQAIQLAAAQAGGSAEAASNALGKMSATIGDDAIFEVVSSRHSVCPSSGSSAYTERSSATKTRPLASSTGGVLRNRPFPRSSRCQSSVPSRPIA